MNGKGMRIPPSPARADALATSPASQAGEVKCPSPRECGERAAGWVFADTIANDRPHPLNEGFSLERFATGHTIDERGAGPTPGYH